MMFDWDTSARSTVLSTAVVEAVSAANGTEPEALDHLLHDAIDPDALDALFAGRDGSHGRVRFRYHGYVVDVDGNGDVTLEPQNRPSAGP